MHTLALTKWQEENLLGTHYTHSAYEKGVVWSVAYELTRRYLTPIVFCVQCQQDLNLLLNSNLHPVLCLA